MKKSPTILLTLSCAACLLLGACGQKGPLYLPEKKAAPVAANKPVATTLAAPSQGQ